MPLVVAAHARYRARVANGPIRALSHHVYVIADDLVHIVSIFYGGRDYEALMRDSGEPS
ncbi:hypothetical protein [Mesorhizobium caraganae]|uniref:hypothetical protein n=1 Tax=Mesorhizobium caraganae TaxID=483206 RepID=UPI0035E3D64F